MNKKLLIAGAIALTAVPAVAQSVALFDTGRKWDDGVNALIEGHTLQQCNGVSTKSFTPGQNIDVNVSVSNADAVVNEVVRAGYEAEAITGDLVVMNIPLDYVKTLAGRNDVLYINSSRQFHPLMFNVRPETGVEKVHTGEGLETPFTGKGVVIGVIDQGFEFRHPAFTNRTARYSTGTVLGTTPPSKDSRDDVGHATHVANIAGGNKIDGSNNHGIAYEADLVMISSSFSSNDVLRQTRLIKNYAEGEGKPWILNMSFGAVVGPHDGTTSYDTGMRDLCGKGALMVAAMGNEGGQKLHAYREFKEDGQTVYLNIQPDANSNPDRVVFSEIWSSSTDGTSHLTIRPVIVLSGTRHTFTDSELTRAGFSTGINPYNKRQYGRLQTYMSSLLSLAGISASSTSAKLLWEVTGNAGDSFHAWVDGVSYPASFTAYSSTSYRANSGDDEYLVGEGAASIPTALAVASYNAASQFTSEDGLTYSVSNGGKGSMSNFSSKGPFLDASNPKPAIAAPGGCISSAFSKNMTQWNAYKDYVTKSVTVNGQKYYYGIMSGTSMATPVVTGIVALWLEANPQLTYNDVLEIFRKTGRRSSQTKHTAATGDWNAIAGYGKIDAYEGLKEALSMANASGINETLNTAEPVSIDKSADRWRILFNNDESYARFSIYDMNGRLVSSTYADTPRRGSEHVMNFDGLAPGVYLIKVSTTASSTTRKVVVR